MSIGGNSGWLPRYLLLRDEAGIAVGALPMYEKHHSWGEYVFDWAWAEAWQRCGLAYYPKLIIAVPFSPVSGHRFLIAAGQNRQKITTDLLQGAITYAKENNYSSLHCLFAAPSECEILQQHGLLIRHDVQFHWKNRNFCDFSAFLAGMNSRKRKKIARERRRVRETGVEFNIISGSELSEKNMERMYEFYLSTIMAHGSEAYLNKEFFLLLGERIPSSIVLIEATVKGKVIAAAMNIRHKDVLFGRYWGCREEFHSLHFETCYYQAIEYCIKHGLSRFEGGAQGEHKLSRGFLPTITCSSHWLADDRLTTAVGDFLEREKSHVSEYRKILNTHSPYKSDPEITT